MGQKALGIVIANTVINVLFLFISVYYCLVVLSIKINFKVIDFILLKEVSIYSFYIFIAVIVDRIYWTVDQVILGMYVSATAVSIYAIASQINMYYMQFSTALSGMFLPKVTVMVTNDSNEHELTEVFLKMGRIQFIILGLILSGFVLFGREFIVLWAGEDYVTAYYIALILITPFTIPLVQNIGLSILQAKNMHRFRSIVLFFIAMGNLAISIPLAQKYGGIGSAIGTAIAMVVGNIIIMNIYYRRKLNINIPMFWKEISKFSIPLLLSLGFGLVLNYMLGFGLLQLILKIGIYSIFYILIIYILGMNKYERKLFLSIFKAFQTKFKGMGIKFEKM